MIKALLLLSSLLGATAVLGAASRVDPAAGFQKNVQPFVTKNCAMCHNAKVKAGSLDLGAYKNTDAILGDREIWEHVVEKVRSGEMPPKGLPRPKEEDLQAFTNWIDSEFARADRNSKPDPGRVTARRLNRYEYNNTVRDLLAVDFHPADDFPADDSGYGFDNIGDVLSLPPVLMEKYLAAAEKISRMAVGTDPPRRPTLERYQAERLKRGVVDGGMLIRHRFPVEADYELRAGVAGRLPDGSKLKIALWIDGGQERVFDLIVGPLSPRHGETKIRLKPGDHELHAAVIEQPPLESLPPPPPSNNPIRYRPVVVDYIEVCGPYDQARPEQTDSYKKVFICGHSPGRHTPECARQIVGDLARRAYRRTVSRQEVESLLRFVSMAKKDGDSFEEGVRVALEAMLVSPHFLFRIERDPKPNDPGAVHAVSEFELASRLSYFLWSSMPDDELFRAAQQKTLRKPGVLDAQVKRMLADPKAHALAENFAGQWLELRNLDSIKPDPDRFRNFDADLRDAMRQETTLFFEAVLKENRSILDFIDGKYTYLNERLAKHYGIPGIKGREFRRVELDTGQRSGVLTQASVLTVSSYPTRTSPVIRGKWLLENILGTPPPPPPPNVPNLDEAAVGNTGSLRQQLEKHRSNATCSSCHARMDPLGFGLENYDAIGAWRTMDGKFPVDSSGTLPNGKTFRTPDELKEILKADRDAFSRCLTEKMLTYALGRGLERYDRPAVSSIVRELARDDYRFSGLIREIVESSPFQMRRGDGVKP